jgi:hypothetical protein
LERLWTWSGRRFCYREGDIIWTHKGRYVGEVYDDEVYDRHGNYIGEIKKGRLITCIKKKGKKRRGHKPHVIQSGRVISDHGRFEKQRGYVMLVDHEDFPRF